MSSRPNPSRPGHDHAPAHPSGLRQTYIPSPYGSFDGASNPTSPPRSEPAADHQHAAGPSRPHASETTSLLPAIFDLREQAHEGPCMHGTFSPRPTSPTGSSVLGDSISPSDSEAEGSVSGIEGVLRGGSSRERRGWKRRWAATIKSKKMSDSTALAQRHGIKASAQM